MTSGDRILAVFERYSSGTIWGDGRIRSATSTNLAGTSWNNTSYKEVYDPPDGERTALMPSIARMSDGRLVCTFATDEDSDVDPETPGYLFQLNSDVKAVVNTDFGTTWSQPVRAVAAGWCPGLLRLHDDTVLSVLTRAVWDEGHYAWDEIRSTRGCSRR